MPDKPITPQQHAAAVEKNYSEYVAIAQIYVGGALAYNPGHAVSSISVQDGTVPASLVAKIGTKAADAVPAPAPASTAPVQTA